MESLQYVNIHRIKAPQALDLHRLGRFVLDRGVDELAQFECKFYQAERARVLYSRRREPELEFAHRGRSHKRTICIQINTKHPIQ
jgi:hypothetical protein